MARKPRIQHTRLRTSPCAGLAGLAAASMLGLSMDPGQAQPAAQGPQIAQQPANCTNRAGTTGNLTVIVSGSLPLRYQWFKDNLPLADDGQLVGTYSATLVILDAAASDEGAYLVTVSNAFGFTNSAAATLTVQPWQPWGVVGSAPNTDEITKRVVVDGARGYLANGYIYTQPSANTGLRIVDVANPTAPSRLGGCRTNYAEANSVAVSGNRAYVVLGTSPPFGLGVVDISNASSPCFLGVYDTTPPVQHGLCCLWQQRGDDGRYPEPDGACHRRDGADAGRGNECHGGGRLRLRG